MGDYTPTTEQIRAHYVFDQSNRWNQDRGKAFDRWLAEHDRELIAERDSIRRLHEEATENAARYSAVIEKARTLVDGTEWGDVTWRDNRNATGRLLATVDASTVLRERDRAIAERAWDELYVTQYDGAQYASEATAAGVRDPNNPYRAEVDRG